MERLGGRYGGETVLKFLARETLRFGRHIRGEDEEKLLVSELAILNCRCHEDFLDLPALHGIILSIEQAIEVGYRLNGSYRAKPKNHVVSYLASASLGQKTSR